MWKLAGTSPTLIRGSSSKRKGEGQSWNTMHEGYPFLSIEFSILTWATRIGH
jgi:hypothetical protein